MGSKSPTWADQWGTGPFSNEEDHDKPMTNKGRLGSSSSKKMDQVKAVASTGLDKAKTAAAVGAKKVKTGSSTGFKWLKNKCSSSK